jgi:hypothetical protein
VFAKCGLLLWSGSSRPLPGGAPFTACREGAGLTQAALFPRTAARFGLLCAVILAAHWPAASHGAATSKRAVRAVPDIERDFSALAQQRPWQCAVQDGAAPPTSAWRAQGELCAWQDRLRMRRWSGAGDAPGAACVSEQARWWAWARNRPGMPAALPAAWRTGWAVQSAQGRSGAEERIVIIRRAPDGQWSATEWRWNPSPRAATRQWQAGRWAQLAARAAQAHMAVEQGAGPREARMLRTVIEGNLGKRAGELGADVWRWPADGLCLRVDVPNLGPQQLQLPYAVDDSRLEQRAAMQLQLARRYPKANWLTAFRLLPRAPQEKGGAKFYAVWQEEGTLKGQLWIPSKADGPLVRVRIDTPVAQVRAGQDETQLNRAGAVVERELAALAARWTHAYE